MPVLEMPILPRKGIKLALRRARIAKETRDRETLVLCKEYIRKMWRRRNEPLAVTAKA